ncbi:unannotated protein [freshwater metagenome]|uniref:Unannotated protein n=1 Tax=freshwater metagenome TaxID=449393 RepID=A0A6J7G3G5_9ZZZZ
MVIMSAFFTRLVGFPPRAVAITASSERSLRSRPSRSIESALTASDSLFVWASGKSCLKRFGPFGPPHVRRPDQYFLSRHQPAELGECAQQHLNTLGPMKSVNELRSVLRFRSSEPDLMAGEPHNPPAAFAEELPNVAIDCCCRKRTVLSCVQAAATSVRGPARHGSLQCLSRCTRRPRRQRQNPRAGMERW